MSHCALQADQSSATVNHFASSCTILYSLHRFPDTKSIIPFVHGNNNCYFFFFFKLHIRMRDTLYKSKITRVEKFGRGSARFRNTKSTKAISFFFLKVKLHIKILHKSKVTMTRLKNLGEKFRLDFESQNQQHFFPRACTR